MFKRIGMLLLMSSIFLSGCSNPLPTASEPVTGGGLVVLTSRTSWFNLDPARAIGGMNVAFASSYLHRSLTAFRMEPGVDGTEVVPDLATGLGQPNSDFTIWTYSLREDAKFETGQKIGCADVRYGVSRSYAIAGLHLVNPVPKRFLQIGGSQPANKRKLTADYKGPFVDAPAAQALFEDAVQCSADNRSISFHLQAPTLEFDKVVTSLAFAPVPNGTTLKDEYNVAPVSSGPYRVQGNTAGDDLVLVRNSEWSTDSDALRQQLPATITVRFGQDPALIDDQIMRDSGEGKFAIGLDGVQKTNLAQVFNDPKLKSRRLNDENRLSYFAAANAAQLKCVALRRAINFSLQRSSWQAALGGIEFAGNLADGLLNPNYFTFIPDASESVSADGLPQKAKSELAAANKECPTLVQRLVKFGVRLAVPDTDSGRASAAVWKSSLESIGLKTKPLLIEESRFYSTLRNAKMYDIALVAWAPELMLPADAFTNVLGDGNANFTHNNAVAKRKFVDPNYSEFVAELDKARGSSSREDANSVFERLNSRAVELGWLMPGVFGRTQFIWGGRVNSVEMWRAYGAPVFTQISVQ